MVRRGHKWRTPRRRPAMAVALISHPPYRPRLHLTGAAKASPRSVLLSIDDGRASVWSFALPLLQRYGAEFFCSSGWRSELDRVVAAWRADAASWSA
jgi:peptidoglycan/xylan/chitin deacetylase (PgdA/CDA1 family)